MDKINTARLRDRIHEEVFDSDPDFREDAELVRMEGDRVYLDGTVHDFICDTDGLYPSLSAKTFAVFDGWANELGYSDWDFESYSVIIFFN